MRSRRGLCEVRRSGLSLRGASRPCVGVRHGRGMSQAFRYRIVLFSGGPIWVVELPVARLAGGVGAVGPGCLEERVAAAAAPGALLVGLALPAERALHMGARRVGFFMWSRCRMMPTYFWTVLALRSTSSPMRS